MNTAAPNRPPTTSPPAAPAAGSRGVRGGRGDRGRALAVAGAVAGAGLVWLQLSSQLAATGRDIASLGAEQADLRERRATALAAYAAVTDPRARAARATALGFAPAAPVELIDGAGPALVDRGPPGADTPLSIMRAAAAGAAARPEADPDVPALLVSLGVAAPAAADARTASTAPGLSPNLAGAGR